MYSGSNGTPWYIKMNDVGSFQMNVQFFVGTHVATSGPVLTRGNWYHIAGSYDGSWIRLYINGQLAASTARSQGIPGGGSGAYLSAMVKTLGDIDELRVWSVARSPDEINCWKNRPLSSVPSTLIAYWTFDNGYLDPQVAFSFRSLTPRQQTLGYIFGIFTLPASGAVFNPAFPQMVLQLSSPAEQYAPVGGTASLTVVPSGSGPFLFRWTLQDPTYPNGLRPLEDGVYVVNGTALFSVVGATSPTMLVTPQSSSPTPYTFVGSASNACSLAVSSPASVATCQRMTLSLTSPPIQNVALGSPATLTVTPTGSAPINYRWTVKDPTYGNGWRPIEDGFFYLNGTLRFFVAGAESATVQITPLTLGPASHQFQGSAANPCTLVVSEVATVGLCSFGSGFPLSSPPSQTVPRGAIALLQGNRPGAGPFSYRWEVFDTSYPIQWRPLVDGQGTAIGNGTFTFAVVGSSTPTLAVQPLGSGPETGLFRLSATLGQGSSGACNTSYSDVGTVVSCITTPVIMTNPLPAQGCQGSTFSFAVGAIGTPPFTYEWQLQDATGNWHSLQTSPVGIDCPGGIFGYAFCNPPNAPTTVINVQGCPTGWAYGVRCVVANACGGSMSLRTTLSLGLRADLNGDNAVNTSDLTFFLGRFGQAAPIGSPPARADFNSDGQVNTADLTFFLGRFGETCQ
jgi:hypothetical protein